MTSAAARHAAGQPATLFAELFDDAAIFPPGNAPLPQAVTSFLSRAGTSEAAYVGTFLCSGSRVEELLGCLAPGARLALSLVESRLEALPGIVERLADDDRITLRGVETVGAGSDGIARTLLAFDRLLPPAAQGYVEIPLDASGHDIGALTGTPYLAKFRTGGPTADAFPDERAIAVAIIHAVKSGVGFKMTAGLHHAVRHRDAMTGFEHHGFANVLGAVGAAIGGRPAPDVERLLAERDREAVVAALPSGDSPAACAVREFFVSFGTCSITEPLADLRAMGLLKEAADDT
jgi:hypothetical protein